MEVRFCIVAFGRFIWWTVCSSASIAVKCTRF